MYGTNDAEAVIPALWLMRCSVSILPFLVYELSAEDRRAVLSELGSALEVQSIAHGVARVIPLEAIAEAHDLVQEGGVVGNVVLAID